MKLTPLGELIVATAPHVLNRPTIPPEEIKPYTPIPARETQAKRDQRLLPGRMARLDATLARIAAYNPEPRIADRRLKVRRANVEKDIDAAIQYRRDKATAGRLKRLIEVTEQDTP